MSQSFIIESRTLRRAAASVRSAVTSNKAIPILNNVRIEADGDRVQLLTTNQDCWAEFTAPAEVTAPFVTTVAAGLLDDIAKTAPEGSQVEISLTDKGATAKAGRARFRLPTLPADMFPPMNVQGIEPQVRIKLADLVAALSSVDYIKAGDHLPHLQGVVIRRTDDGIECATFDGKRLSRCPAEADAQDFDPFTIPGDVVGKIKAVMDAGGDEVTIGHNGRLALISSASARFLCRLIEGKFTQYWTHELQLVGEPVLFSSKEMMAAINRVGLAQDQYHNGVAVELEPDRISFTLRNQQGGEASDAVCVGYSGEAKRLGLKLQDLRDAVSRCPGDEAEMRFDTLGNAHIAARSPQAPRHAMAPMQV